MKSRFYLSTQVSIAQPLQQSSTDCLYPCDECTLKGYAHPFAFVYPSDLNLEDLSARRASSSSQFGRLHDALPWHIRGALRSWFCVANHSFTGQGVWTAARLAQMSSRTPGGKTLLKRSIWIFSSFEATSSPDRKESAVTYIIQIIPCNGENMLFVD